MLGEARSIESRDIEECARIEFNWIPFGRIGKRQSIQKTTQHNSSGTYNWGLLFRSSGCVWSSKHTSTQHTQNIQYRACDAIQSSCTAQTLTRTPKALGIIQPKWCQVNCKFYRVENRTLIPPAAYAINLNLSQMSANKSCNASIVHSFSIRFTERS